MSALEALPLARHSLRVALITAEAPWGRGESYVLSEIAELRRRVEAVLVLPAWPGSDLFHGDVSRQIAQNAVSLPLLGPATLASATVATLRSPGRVIEVLTELVRESRNGRILFRNLVAFPKAVRAARLVREFGAHHIHAHWASVPATMALVVSRLTGIPWSFTAHRWDITEDNLLTTKIRAAAFARAISLGGRQRILRITGEETGSALHTIHVGTEVPEGSGVQPLRKDDGGEFVIACIGNLQEVKGHRFLIEACARLRERGHRFTCRIIGDGPLRGSLTQLVNRRRLGDCVRLQGPLAHAGVLAMLAGGQVDLVVLASIQTVDGAHEGIPVTLMEALAHRVPVVSTETGDIRELLGEGAGILVPPGDSLALANAIEGVLVDADQVTRLVETGFRKVSTGFNIRTTVDRLLCLMENARKDGDSA